MKYIGIAALIVLLVGPCALAADPPKDGKPKHINRLAKESSPYLLQHAHNPVDWYPWGAEAFAKAKKEGKLVFLSIGYSSCHWCHVMEKESFADEATAKLMNEYFVCIKVDRSNDSACPSARTVTSFAWANDKSNTFRRSRMRTIASRPSPQETW